MRDVIEPLRNLREQLHGGLNTLQVAASAVDTAEPRMAMNALEGALAYLQDEFLPMCRAEESEFFVRLAEITGREDACRAMVAQHTSMIRMVGDLAQAVEAAKASGGVSDYAHYLHPLLYGLYALCRVHIESEDEAYLPLVAVAMAGDDVEAMVRAMERAAATPRT